MRHTALIHEAKWLSRLMRKGVSVWCAVDSKAMQSHVGPWRKWMIMSGWTAWMLTSWLNVTPGSLDSCWVWMCMAECGYCTPECDASSQCPFSTICSNKMQGSIQHGKTSFVKAPWLQCTPYWFWLTGDFFPRNTWQEGVPWGGIWLVACPMYLRCVRESISLQFI